MNPSAVDAGSQSLSFAIFAALVSVTLLLCIMTSAERDDLDEFYTGFRTLAPLRNGLAIAGDYISAATVLSTIGIIALTGFDGLLLALSTALSLLLLMVLLAEPLRNAGRFTMGDALVHGGASRLVRLAATAVTLASLLPLMVFQLAGAGHLVTLVLGFEGSSVRTAIIVALGTLMIGYAGIGGMKGTALIHIIKLVVLFGASLMLALLVMDKVGWDPSRLVTLADIGSGRGAAYARSGLLIEPTAIGKADLIASSLTVVFGAACLPHVTMRMYTARSAPDIRRAMSYAVMIMAVFVVLIAVIGAGATALLGREVLAAGGPQGSTAILQLAQGILADSAALSTFVFTTVATAVFLTLLSSVAGMILACGNSLAHDLYANVLKRSRKPLPRRELLVARLAAFAVGAPAIALAVLMQDRALRALIILSFSIAASAIAPALLYGLFWRRFTRLGMLGSLVGGTVTAVVVTVFSTTVSGTPESLFPEQHFDRLQLTTSGMISIPVGFLLGWLGTVLSGRRRQERRRQRYRAVEPRLLAGARRR
ncbi:cation acetate symporter [Streptomyces nanshensis]|uniref:Transporter n=1 Tax=Streptomyces nanshensis TaxID=518642 RepID=A0A1E7L598_9ACTN|nr:cation acetate symporter [Streptomyces nanshensis]OEV11291.1 transporter [Streptomyces nanshensis]